MKHTKIYIISGIIILLGVTQFTGNFKSSELTITEIPNNFEYDGCSMVPDGDLLDCCTIHDQGYFGGGSWQERLRVDNEFYSCVGDKGHWYSPALAPIMWTGVRIGGAPIFPTSYRWGFGRDRY